MTPSGFTYGNVRRQIFCNETSRPRVARHGERAKESQVKNDVRRSVNSLTKPTSRISTPFARVRRELCPHPPSPPHRHPFSLSPRDGERGKKGPREKWRRFVSRICAEPFSPRSFTRNDKSGVALRVLHPPLVPRPFPYRADPPLPLLACTQNYRDRT